MADDDLVTGLRAWVKNHDNRVRAAVELLIEHDHWLWDEGFTERCIFDSNGTPYVNFAEVRRYHDDKPGCSESQAAILLVIADIGSGRWQVDTMDGRNRRRVADAVLRAAGLSNDG